MKTPPKISPGAAQQLEGLIAGWEPKLQALLRSVRKVLRSRFPSTDELVYDYPHSLVIGYSPTGRGMESVVAIGLREDGLRLYFNQWSKLPDPAKMLQGSGKQARYIPVPSVGMLETPEVEALLRAASVQASPPLIPDRRGTLIIQSGAAKPGKAGKRATSKTGQQPKARPSAKPTPKPKPKSNKPKARKRATATR